MGTPAAPVSAVRVDFNMPMDSTTFQTNDVISFTGPGGDLLGTLTGVTPVTAGGQSVSFDVTFSSQIGLGSYTMKIGGSIQDTFARFVDQDLNGIGNEATDTASTTYSISSPRVLSATPSGKIAPPVNSVRITYSALMNSSTFDISDIVSFTGPTGSLLASITGITPVTSGGQSYAFDINFPDQTLIGSYNITIGSNIEDVYGRKVDQNKDGTQNGAGDQYPHSFEVSIPGIYVENKFGYRAYDFPYQTVTLTSPLNLTFVNSTDDDSAVVDLGANKFTFYDQVYTGKSLYASTNALITFGSGNSAYDNSAGLSSISQPAIAVLWDDYRINTTGSPQARYQLRDTNGDTFVDQLAIEWLNTRHYDVGGTVNFQALLELNTGTRPGRITLNYTDLQTNSSGYSNGAQATVGIKSTAALNSSLLVAQNTADHPLLNDLRAIQFSVPYVKSITRLDPSTMPDGDVEFEVTFSEPVTGVNAGDFALTTTGTIANAKVDHVHSTGDPAVFTVHCESGIGSGNLRLDVIDNDSIVSSYGAKLGGVGLVNGDFKAGETYTIVQQPAKVDALFIGDGTSARSIVKQVRIDFDKTVVFSPNPESAFELTGPSGAMPVYVDLSLSDDERTVAILQFVPIGQPQVSLPDGKYTLTAFGSNITTGGVNFDGDNNGSPGGNYETQFHRLFGDADGNMVVNSVDFAAFRAVFGTSNGASIFDIDGDGIVNANDFSDFRKRFGINLGP